MNTAVVQWGILSTASINEHIISALRQAPHAELLAVASRDAVRAAEYTGRHQIPRAYGTYEELLADLNIQAVYASLPNRLHAHWTVAALQAGKHVLCEKPLARTAEEALKVTQVARATGLVVLEAFMYRFHPPTRRLLSLVMCMQ